MRRSILWSSKQSTYAQLNIVITNCKLIRMNPSIMQNMNNFLPTDQKREVVGERCEIKKMKVLSK